MRIGTGAWRGPVGTTARGAGALAVPVAVGGVDRRGALRAGADPPPHPANSTAAATAPTAASRAVRRGAPTRGPWYAGRPSLSLAHALRPRTRQALHRDRRRGRPRLARRRPHPDPHDDRPALGGAAPDAAHLRPPRRRLPRRGFQGRRARAARLVPEPHR